MVFLYRLNLPFHYYVFVCILPEKAVAKMIYTVSGGTLNHTHSFCSFWHFSQSVLRQNYHWF